MTDRDDTLWKIAQRSRPGDGVSVQQNMLAIQRLNPEAFIGGNINLLKAGYKLRLPKEADVAAISSTEAIAEVAAQNQAWQAYRRGESLASVPTGNSGSTAATESQALAGQVDATAKPTTKAAASGPDGELRIVAGEPSEKGTGAGGGSADAADLENQLASAKEEADRIALERDDAKSKLNEATSQAEQAKRQIEVRDQQIAQMQAQLKAAKQNEAAATPVAAKQETGGLMALLASPLVMGGAAVVLVLIVVAGLMRARGRRRAEDDERAAFEAVEPMRSATGSARTRARVEEIAEEEPEAVESTLQEHHEEEHEVPHHEGAQTSDVIGEADIYIAYGRYPQAVSLLLGALDDDPNRSDVRVKLLEVYAETKDEAGFEKHMSELLTRCDDNELLLEARELETKLREDEPVAAAVTNASKAPTATTTPTLDDFQLDLDAEEDDVATTRSNAFAEREDEASDDLGGDLGIDFKADDEPTVMRTQTASRAKADLGDVAVAADEEDDEFDLEDLEFEPAARSDAKTQSRSAAAPESDDAFEFLNEEDAATTKLDLARAYIDMGDEDGAREILSEVLQEGSNEQQAAANELLAKLK